MALLERLFDELVTMVRTGQGLTADAVERSIAMLRAETSERPADVLTLNILSNRGRTIRPKTLNQKRYVDAIDAHTVIFGIGPAGTGKTYLAMAKAVQALQAKQVNRIILTRPAVEAGERLGFLPGTLSEKIDPYLRPLYDALHDMLDPETIPKLLTSGTIEVAPLAYMRGRSLNDAFIILDEAQNTSPEQMKMFLTRLGFGSQDGGHRRRHADRPPGRHQVRSARRPGHPGDVRDIGFIWLTEHDVVRHKLVGGSCGVREVRVQPATGAPVRPSADERRGPQRVRARARSRASSQARAVHHPPDAGAPAGGAVPQAGRRATMSDYNQRFMGKTGPTDVLVVPDGRAEARTRGGAGARRHPR